MMIGVVLDLVQKVSCTGMQLVHVAFLMFLLIDGLDFLGPLQTCYSDLLHHIAHCPMAPEPGPVLDRHWSGQESVPKNGWNQQRLASLIEILAQSP